MTNTIIKYDNIESLKFITQDYTSKDFSKILDLPELQSTDWIDYIDLLDDQTIEQVSFNTYGSADFWDILIIINDADPLFDMPYNFDIIDTEAVQTVQTYLSGYSGAYKSDTFDRLKNIILNKFIDENEANRKIKIIQPAKLYDFIKLVNELGL